MLCETTLIFPISKVYLEEENINRRTQVLDAGMNNLKKPANISKLEKIDIISNSSGGNVIFFHVGPSSCS